MPYRFGDYTLDTQRYELCHTGQRVPLRPKVFHVLTYLLAQRHRVVSKDELMGQVWPGQSLSEETLSTCIAAARRAVGDSGQQQQIIQTRHGHGYRFVAAVECRDAAPPHQVPLESSPPGGLVVPLGGDEAALPTAPVVSLEPLHPSPQPFLGGEQKQVTVLVCTLALAATGLPRWEAEAQHQALQAFFALVLEAIAPYAGTLQRLLDDGCLVLFGAPVAQEDHAQRAVLAALGVQQRLRTVPPDAALALEEACAVRMGLHTGQILLGTLGEAQHLTYTAVGDVTQHAAWLAQQAAPGTILVSAATVPLVQGAVRLAACASLSLAGQTVPGPSYQVLGRGARPTPLLPDGGRPYSRFVGRELELATLQALLTRVTEGQGQVVGIVGEPGLGKTRLLAEFWHGLGDRRVTRLEGRCESYGQATPYGPVLGLLRQACGCTEVDSPAVVTATVEQYLQALGLAPAEAAPVLLPLLGVPDSGAPLVNRTPQERRAQTFATLHQLLRHESQRLPLLVVVENLHWIDPTSQDYLAEVVERLPSVPLLLLVTFRPGYRPPWMARSYATQLALPRLRPADSRRVVQGVLHPVMVPEPLLQDILAKAAGNPLFLEELAWTVREHGDLRLPPDVPATLQAVLTARIDRLPLAAKQVLQTAAVIGTEVRLSLLQALTTRPEAALGPSLHHLHTAEFLYETHPAPDRTYAFKHVITQEAAYQSLLQHTRQQVHRQVAQVLEAQFPATAETQPEVLAQHYTAAGLGEQAVGYWQRAGQRAVEQSAYVEAVVHCTRGLDVLRTLPDTPARAQHELDMQIALGRALTITRGFAALETGQAFARARELCHQVGDVTRLFAVLEGLHDFYMNRGDFQTIRDLDQEYLTLAQRQHDPERLAWIHLEMGVPLYFLGELVPARAHFEHAVSLCTSTQPHSLTLHEHSGVPCLAYTAFTLWMLGYPDQALARCHDMLSLAQALSHPYRLARALQYAAWLHGLRREGATAQAQAEASLALSTDQGFAHWVGDATFQRGLAMAMQGQREEGIAQMQQGLAAKQATGQGLARRSGRLAAGRGVWAKRPGRGRATPAGGGAGGSRPHWGALL